MQDNINAIEYAKAIFELAKEEKQVEQIYDELLGLEEIFKDDPKLLFWFTTLEIGNNNKLDFFEQCFSKHIHWIFNNFFHYLILKNDERLILKIFYKLESFLCQELKIIKVEVTTPYELTNTQLSKLEQVISRKLKSKIKILVKINESLIGGIKIRYGDKDFDGTVIAKLNDLRNKIKGEI